MVSGYDMVGAEAVDSMWEQFAGEFAEPKRAVERVDDLEGSCPPEPKFARHGPKFCLEDRNRLPNGERVIR